MPIRRILSPLATLVLAGCGAIGDLQPPTLDIPRQVTDLRAVELADKIVIDFTIPELTTEGLALRLAKVDVRAGPYAQSPFDPEAWAAQAQVLDTTGLTPGPARLELKAERWIGQEVFFRVRLFSHKGKDSGWSQFTALSVISPLQTPFGLKAEPVAEGVRLSWAGPQDRDDVRFRILRRTSEGAAVEVATVRGPEWLDTDTRFGRSYAYSLQAVVMTGTARAESQIGPLAAITPVDLFPPAIPKGLTGMAASSSIDLAWDPNGEADLRGYYVYRASGDQRWQRLDGAVGSPSYSDREVKPATRYRYAVSSVDLSGNESERSETVEVTLP